MYRWLSKTPEASLPIEIYVSSVDALYSDARSLYAGTISAALAAAVTGWKTGAWPFFLCALVLTIIGLMRGHDMRAYAHQAPKPDSHEAARRWEVRYIVGSGAFVAVLAIWCFLTFALSDDPAVHLISFSVSLAYLVGITGRNFSSDQLVTTQTVCAAVPMIAGLVIQQNGYYAFLAALLVPFFMSLRFISARLRRILLDAVVATHDIRSLADRFDTALNNMPHGLCMFDSENRYVVSNGTFEKLLDIPADAAARGTPAEEMLRASARIGGEPGVRADRLLNGFVNRLGDDIRRTSADLEFSDGATLQVTFQPMERGGHVVLVEDITERRAAEAKIEHMARFDALTGLANRTHFAERFDRIIARAGTERHALLFIDLDQFKTVNDTLGHPCGDILLCEVAARLKRLLPEPSLVARFGGDEFVVMHDLPADEEAEDLAARIIEALSEPYEVNAHQIIIGASVGIAIAPEDGETFEQVLKNADIALYSAKASGRGVWRFFEADMDARAQERRALEMDIREALQRKEFEVHYQPIVNVRNGRTTVCEALLRWPHSDRGMISPGVFIPLAEEMGLITELGTWVLQKACTECAGWPGDVRVAVNISPIQFERTDLVAVVKHALEESGLAPHRLEIEITESVLLKDTDTARDVLTQLHELGVHLSLDDFGTGYSSLSYLHSFPLNKIKIDRSFLNDMRSESRSLILLQSVARLCADLGMSVVVEGVETHAQLVLLCREKDIDEVQGFLFSAALPEKDIRSRLAAEEDGVSRVA